jgi:hypothetical protein
MIEVLNEPLNFVLRYVIKISASSVCVVFTYEKFGRVALMGKTRKIYKILTRDRNGKLSLRRGDGVIILK